MSRTVLRRVGALAFGLGLAFSVLSAPASAFAARTIGISAASRYFNVTARQTGKGDVTVMNDGTVPIRVMVYVANQLIDKKTGKKTFDVPKFGTPAYQGPATWFNIKMPANSKALGNIPYIDLDPGEKVPVNFSFTVPDDVPAGDHQALIFFEMVNPPGKGTTAASVSGRLGSRIHIRVQGTLIEKMSVEPFAVRNLVVGDLMPWNFVIRNDGNVDKTAAGKLEILDSNDNVVLTSQVVTETVLYANSMSERSGNLRLSKMVVGPYKARLTVTYPSEPDSRGQTAPVDIVKARSIWVLPLWLVIGVIAIVGSLVLYMAWRQALWSAERKLAKRREEAVEDLDEYGSAS